MTKKYKHGGARVGAGKPAQYDKPMLAVEVTLDEETIKFYKSIGNGNLSKGIREYWRGLTMLAPDKGGRRFLINYQVCHPCG